MKSEEEKPDYGFIAKQMKVMYKLLSGGINTALRPSVLLQLADCLVLLEDQIISEGKEALAEYDKTRAELFSIYGDLYLQLKEMKGKKVCFFSCDPLDKNSRFTYRTGIIGIYETSHLSQSETGTRLRNVGYYIEFNGTSRYMPLHGLVGLEFIPPEN